MIARNGEIVRLTLAVGNGLFDFRAKGEQRGFTDLISLELLTGNECEPNELIAPALSASNAVHDHMDVTETRRPNQRISVRVNSAPLKYFDIIARFRIRPFTWAPMSVQ